MEHGCGRRVKWWAGATGSGTVRCCRMGESGANPELTRNGVDRPESRGEPENPHGVYVKEVEPRAWATACCCRAPSVPVPGTDATAPPVGVPFSREYPT
ncbi:hypothetical protein GCM10022284_42780 [Streptomyces hundungensis]